MDLASPAPLAVVAPTQGSEVERSETGDPGVGDTTAARAPTGLRPDPEVPPKARRRQFSAQYKRDILRRADACSAPGELGEFLRSEGLYSSHLTTWRVQSARGELAGLTSQKRGRKPDPDKRVVRELEVARRENERLRGELRKAETIIEIQKKLSTLLGIDLPSPDSRNRRIG